MGQLVFQATLGGQVNLVGPNTASTFNLSVPAVTATLATTDANTFTASQTFSAGAANGVAYLNGSKVLTTGSALTFDGTSFGLNQTSGAYGINLLSGGYGTLAKFGVVNAGTDNNSFIGSVSNNNFLIKTYNSTVATFDTSGNLGLGVTPSAWISSWKALEQSGVTLASSSTIGIVGQNWYINSGGTDIYRTTAAASVYKQTAGQHQWLNAPSGTAGNAITFTQAMTLDSSGNLLVGVTSAGTDKVRFASAGNTSNQLGLVSTDDASGNGYIQFRNSATTSIGSITRVTTTNAVIYNTTSDYRLKNVIGAITGQGERIDALKPIDYQWKEDGSNARGFLAHEFQEVYANSVTGTKDAVDAEGNPIHQAMQASTPEVIADLVAEIQSLRKRLAAAGI